MQDWSFIEIVTLMFGKRAAPVTRPLSKCSVFPPPTWRSSESCCWSANSPPILKVPLPLTIVSVPSIGTTQLTSVTAYVLKRPSEPVGVSANVPLTPALVSGQRQGSKHPCWYVL